MVLHLVPNSGLVLAAHLPDDIMSLVALCAMEDYVSAPESWLCNRGPISSVTVNWPLFQTRAAALRELTWSEPRNYCASCFNHISCLMRASSVGTGLLPNLHAMEIRSETAHGLRGIQQWIPPSIQCLKILFGPGIDHEAILTFLAELAPSTQIKDLTLSWSSQSYTRGQTYDISLRLSDLCKSLVFLQVLCIPMDLVRDTVLDALSALPNLQSVTFSPRRSFGGARTLRRAGGFDNIRGLVVSELSEDADIIRSTNGHSLHVLRTANAHSGSMSHIAQMCVNLRELFIEIPFEESVSFLPLASCRNLEILDIRAQIPLLFTHYDLRDLLDSCWYIRHLSLNPRPSRVPPECMARLPTLQALIAAAECGPHLAHLGIYLNSSGHSSRHANVGTWEGLELLDLGASTCGCGVSAQCEIQVAKRIIGLFPRVRLQADSASSGWVRRLASRLDEVARHLR